MYVLECFREPVNKIFFYLLCRQIYSLQNQTQFEVN